MFDKYWDPSLVYNLSGLMVDYLIKGYCTTVIVNRYKVHDIQIIQTEEPIPVSENIELMKTRLKTSMMLRMKTLDFRVDTYIEDGKMVGRISSTQKWNL